MQRRQLSRRAMLAGSAGAAIALPWLEAMAPMRVAQAAAAAPPKRFVALVTCGGILPQRFWPTLAGEPIWPLDKVPSDYYVSGGVVTPTNCSNQSFECIDVKAVDTSDYIMSPALTPLTKHKDDLLIIEGLDSSGGPGHDQWPSTLNGRLLKNSDVSVDQEIANLIAGNTKFKSLQMGVRNGGGTPVSWFGPSKPAVAEDNPQVIFDRIFAEVGAPDTTAIDRLRAQRKSVLDAAGGQVGELQKQLGHDDSAKLQNYLESIREVESRLSNVAGGASCGRPKLTVPGNEWWRNDSNTPLALNTQLDILAMAFACDLTRVASISVGSAGSPMTLPWLGVTESFHDGLGHAPSNNMIAQNKIAKIDIWNAEMLAGFIDRLKAIPEGTGTVFDSTVIMWVQELTRGNMHDQANMPHIVAGSSNGFLKKGRYIRLPRTGPNKYPYKLGRWSNDFKATMVESMGGPAKSFGDPTQFTAPLDTIKA